ncbi:hypothetical protein RYR35_002081, partial [Streptococcus iniae]|nr:hypothetical protein [Streptococcus iniae]
ANFILELSFGLIGALFIKYYHLSIEKNGFLFLKRNPWNLKFVENNYFFIPNEDIQEVVLTKGVGFQKLTLTALDGKKTNYLIPKKLYGVPWLAESLKEANNRYASK